MLLDEGFGSSGQGSLKPAMLQGGIPEDSVFARSETLKIIFQSHFDSLEHDLWPSEGHVKFLDRGFMRARIGWHDPRA